MSSDVPPKTSPARARGEAREDDGHLVRELHGVTLEQIVTHLVETLGWSELGARVPIHCFKFDPSVKSSLKFLRRTPWARTKVEALYIAVRSEAR